MKNSCTRISIKISKFHIYFLISTTKIFSVKSLSFQKTHTPSAVLLRIIPLRLSLSSFSLLYTPRGKSISCLTPKENKIFVYSFFEFKMLCHKKIFKFLAPIHAKYKKPPLCLWKSYLLQPLVMIFDNRQMHTN